MQVLLSTRRAVRMTFDFNYPVVTEHNKIINFKFSWRKFRFSSFLTRMVTQTRSPAIRHSFQFKALLSGPRYWSVKRREYWKLLAFSRVLSCLCIFVCMHRWRQPVLKWATMLWRLPSRSSKSYQTFLLLGQYHHWLSSSGCLCL